MAAKSEKVSPTAYATGYFWYRHGLSHPGLITPEGQRLDRGFQLMIRLTRALSGVSLEALMLTRHRGIDAVLSQAIDSGKVGQVIEIAAGLSPRGWDFMRRYEGRLAYFETDLAAMAATKQNLLEESGLLRPGHSVVELDALADSGPKSLDSIAASLSPKLGTAIITEGLMNYLAPEQARAVWARIAKALRRFPAGLYLTDAYLQSENRSLGMAAFGAVLQAFVRGRMHIHFTTEEQAASTMRVAGFASTRLHKAADLEATRQYAGIAGADGVRVLESWV